MNNPGHGFVVVQHGNPPQGAYGPMPPQNVPPATSHLEKFRKVQPEALGTVQIMTGVFIFLMGIVTSINGGSASFYSGIMFWGAIIHITAGSLTVRASKNLNSCLVKASLGMNIVSALTAVTAISMYGLDYIYVFPADYYYYERYCSSSPTNHFCYLYVAKAYGITSVMMGLAVMQFIVAICLSAFGCKATCHSEPGVMYVNNQVAYSNPNHQMPYSSPTPQVPYSTPNQQVAYSNPNQQMPYSIPNPHLPGAPPHTSEMPSHQPRMIPLAQPGNTGHMMGVKPEYPAYQY